MRPKLIRMAKDSYSEIEAAGAIGISVTRLHALLDRYVFTGAHRRPQTIEFTSSDLLLLSYWESHGKHGPDRGADNDPKVIAMPFRR